MVVLVSPIKMTRCGIVQLKSFYSQDIKRRLKAEGLKVFVPNGDVIIGTSGNYSTSAVMERCRTILAVLSPQFIAGSENSFLKMVNTAFYNVTEKPFG